MTQDILTQDQLIDVVQFYWDRLFVQWPNMLLYAVIAGVATILFKSLLESLAGYITFRLDRFMKVGTPIEYKGKFGHVKSVSVTQIVLEFQTGYLSLPVRKWTSNEFIVLKDKTLEQKQETT